MPPLIKVQDQLDLVKTSDFPYANWSFEKFNPVQSRIMDFYDKDMNGLVAASTSSGKTVIAEQFLSYEIRKRGGKGMFLVPMRALAQEKIDQWTDKNYHFKDLKVSVCTGDYRITKERAKELEDADLIIMTSEMLSHRSRNFQAEQNSFLKNIGTLVIDESHLLTVPGRGDHLEVGLMKFTEINKDARIILLSATMPNVEEVAGWVSYGLTKKDTFVLESKFRPVPLNIHYEVYDDKDVRSYSFLEQEKINLALDIVEYYPEDKFLIFSHTKKTGELMKKELSKIGIVAEFHNADLDKKSRISLENRFKNEKEPRVIVATSTLAWGCYVKDTPVLMANDTIKKIQDIVPGDCVYSMSNNGFVAKKILKTGPKKSSYVYKIELSSGEEIIVSPDHYFYGAIGRKNPDFYSVKDFRVKDLIAVPDALPQKNIVKSDDYGYLVGYVLGDGCKTFCGKHADQCDKFVMDIAFGNHEIEHLKYFSKLFNDVLGYKFESIKTDSNNVLHLITKKRSVLENFSFFKPGRKKHTLSFFDLPRNDKPFIRGVLQGLFDSDGVVSKHLDNASSIEFSSISRNLVIEIQQLLLIFGVRSSIGKKRLKDRIINGRFQKARRKYTYRVRIYNKQVSSFIKYIGFRNKLKQQKALVAIKNQSCEGCWNDYYNEKNTIPARGLLKEHAESNHVSSHSMCNSVNIDFWNSTKKQDLKYDTCVKILNKYKKKSSLNNLINSNIRFSKIKKIKKIKKSYELFDIEIEDLHNYVGGGCISHNCNLPARRVIILGVHRGSEEVESYDVLQMVGRSGRLGIDPAGDAYVLIPETEQLKYKQKFSKSSRIESQLLEKFGSNYKNLAFHLVSEIYHESIQTTDDVHKWFERSLAYFQNKQLQDKIVDDTLESLKKCGAIGLENDKWYARTIGKVSSIFYYSPFDVSGLFFNIKFLFDNNKQDDEYYVSMAFANLDSNRLPIVSKSEKDEMSAYKFKVLSNKTNKPITEGSVKYGFAYFNLMKGKVNPVFASLQRNLQLDFNRLSQAVQMLDSLGGKWRAKDWIKNLEAMITYGVPQHLVSLCSVPNIGKVRANKLYDAGIKDKKSLINYDKDALRKILNMKIESVEKLINDASENS
jgi:replicative superfamily II helicase